MAKKIFRIALGIEYEGTAYKGFQNKRVRKKLYRAY